MPPWPQQQGYSVEPQVAYPPQTLQHPPQPQFVHPSPAGYGQPSPGGPAAPYAPSGQAPGGYPYAAVHHAPGYAPQPHPQAHPQSMPFPAAPQSYPPQAGYPPAGYPPQQGYGYGAPPGYPAAQIIYVQPVAYQQQQPTHQTAGQASWATEDSAKGFDEMPDMPGGWYQPPSNNELLEMNRVGPAIPLGAGAGGTFVRAHLPGQPSADPLVSHDFGSWFMKTIRSIALSWKGLFAVNAVGLAITGVLLWLVGGLLQGAFAIDQTLENDPASFIIPGIVLLVGLSLTALIGISATQAAAAYVVVTDAEEGRGRLRLGKALFFGASAVPRLLWGAFATMFLMVIFTIAGFVTLIFAIIPAAKATGPVAPLVDLIAGLTMFCPAIYLFVTMQTSMVGVASFETGSIIARSRSRIRGHWWSMFARSVVVGAIIFAISLAMANVFQLNNLLNSPSDMSTGTNPASPSSLVISFVIYVLAFCIQAPAQLVSYAELRSRVDGPAITDLLVEQSI
jgi:hypothetical protein